MGEPWFRLDANVPDTASAYKLGVSLNNPLAWAHVVSLYCWCRVNQRDGDLTDVPEGLIAIASKYTGDPKLFVQAMIEAEYLAREDGRLTVVDWGLKNGGTAEIREYERARKRRYRERTREESRTGPPKVPDTVPDTVPDKPETDTSKCPGHVRDMSGKSPCTGHNITGHNITGQDKEEAGASPRKPRRVPDPFKLLMHWMAEAHIALSDKPGEQIDTVSICDTLGEDWCKKAEKYGWGTWPGEVTLWEWPEAIFTKQKSLGNMKTRLQGRSFEGALEILREFFDDPPSWFVDKGFDTGMLLKAAPQIQQQLSKSKSSDPPQLRKVSEADRQYWEDNWDNPAVSKPSWFVEWWRKKLEIPAAEGGQR